MATRTRSASPSGRRCAGTWPRTRARTSSACASRGRAPTSPARCWGSQPASLARRTPRREVIVSMHPGSLLRLSALAGIVGGAGIVALDLAQIVMTVSRRMVGLIELPITILVLLALPGLYVIQAARAGRLGLAGFLLTYTGVALGMGHFYLLAFVRGAIAETFPEAAAAVGGAARTVAPAELASFVLGWILFGAATMRARVLPRVPAAMLIVGVILVLTRPLLPVDGPVGGLVIGAGIAWLSVALYRMAGTG